MKAAVVALGKIGLPLAVQIARSGVDVVGVDVNETVVELVNSGTEPFPGEEHLADYLPEVVQNGRLRATTDFAEALAEADVVIVVVPVIVDREANPDFAAIDAATEQIGRNLKPGALVSYETTLPVHTTRERFVPNLERASSKVSGRDFFVCHSPERVYTGRVFSDLRRYPKLVGGIDERAAELAVRFYETVLEFDVREDLDRPNGVWDLGTAEAAELAKLAETTYRNINIGFANELAMHAHEIGVDISQVIAASNSQPFSHIHRPGIAVGGHCIPVYPKFYLSVDRHAAIPAAAIRVNEAMPAWSVERLRGQLGELAGRRIAVLGAAYRGGVKETAFSGVFDLVAALRAAGATPLVHDEMYTDAELQSIGFEVFHIGDRCDGAIVQTDHASYRNLGQADLDGCRAIFDGRGILEPSRFPDVDIEVLGAGDRP